MCIISRVYCQALSRSTVTHCSCTTFSFMEFPIWMAVADVDHLSRSTRAWLLSGILVSSKLHFFNNWYSRDVLRLNFDWEKFKGALILLWTDCAKASWLFIGCIAQFWKFSHSVTIVWGRVCPLTGSWDRTEKLTGTWDWDPPIKTPLYCMTHGWAYYQLGPPMSLPSYAQWKYLWLAHASAHLLDSINYRINEYRNLGNTASIQQGSLF